MAEAELKQEVIMDANELLALGLGLATALVADRTARKHR
ncbi:hypothetical protein DFAR_340057 [Desulfarculales bacterium]